MNLETRISAFSRLGEVLKEFVSGDTKNDHQASDYSRLLLEAVKQAYTHNAWFTHSNVIFSLHHWGQLLSKDRLNTWISSYSFKEQKSRTIAIIMAGNIPLVGFHDYLCALITGHKVLVKQSSNDKILLNALHSILIDLEPQLEPYVRFTTEQLSDFDAVIATGSNNTARYFEYYFGKYPGIIRKNRNAVAVITGQESETELEALSDDIFRYYGLGCRNVSKLYVPKNYDFDLFFKAIYKWHPIIHEHKYANNYDYNKAVYLMSEFEMLDNGFMVLKEDEQLTSPIATLNFEYYEDAAQLKLHLENIEDDIQCIVAKDFLPNEVMFGETQQPLLDSYADGVDTVEFLLTI